MATDKKIKAKKYRVYYHGRDFESYTVDTMKEANAIVKDRGADKCWIVLNKE
jgi:hypothetical protein